MKYLKPALCVFIIFCAPSFALASVSINEIAWMGTSDSASNEWIELANNEGVSVDLTGWVLSIEGKKDISLSGSIGANSFYLIERTDDTTVPTVPADLVASFGTGITNTGAVISLKNTSGVLLDRVDGSKEWNIDGVVAGNNATKETAQKVTSGWFTGEPTPRALNIGGVSVTPLEQPVSTIPYVSSTPSNISSFPVEPQIIADAGVATRSVSSGATIVFKGRVFGLKKEPIENARLVWSFGDGGHGEGVSVNHTYYYPGEYIAVLEASSGYYSASDRVAVHVSLPLLSLRSGGVEARSFVSIENYGSDEVDLSEWQVENNGKIFTLPQNTILGAKKIITLPSEISGLITPAGSTPDLNFPNGTRVELKNDKVVAVAVPKVTVAPVVKNAEKARVAPPLPQHQVAAVMDALPDTQEGAPVRDRGSLWPWYIGAAFLGALALVGIRLTQEDEGDQKDTPGADDFEIIEEQDDEEPH